MTFLNKKEEVIKIELTPYGRHLLSLGKMEPVFYSFFDDAILYDNSDSGGNTVIKKRILEETPYMKPLYSFISVDRQLSVEERDKTVKNASYPAADNKINFLNYPLGTSANTSGQKAPAWKAVFLHGSASMISKVLSAVSNSTSISYLTASLTHKNIPQIDSNINYKVSIQNENDQKISRGIKMPTPNQPVSRVYPDGTFVQLKEEQNLVYLSEQNGFQHNESFDIEIFLHDELDEKKLIPLKFTNRNQNISNDLNYILHHSLLN